MTAMGPMMDGMMGGVEASQQQDAELFSSFQAGGNQALFLAASAATLAAVLVSFLVSRRVVEPVQLMMDASQRIAEGHYDERVLVRGAPAPDEMDELDQLAVSFNQMADRLERAEN